MSRGRCELSEHFHFTVAQETLVGCLHRPQEFSAGRPGLLLLHGWAGYRIGAHQMFVKLAREAAKQGHPCLRFDFRGRGDSTGEMMQTTLTTMIRDTRQAAQELIERTGCKEIILVGDCSGCEVAIGAAPGIPQAASMVLWSAPIVGASREASDEAKRKDIVGQYWSKLFRRETWAKLIGGKLQLGMVLRALRRGGKGAGEQGAESDRDIDWLGSFTGFPGDVQFVYGTKDPTTEACIEHFGRLTEKAGRPWRCHLVEGANHAFYSSEWEREVIRVTLGLPTGLACEDGGRDAG